MDSLNSYIKRSSGFSIDEPFTDSVEEQLWYFLFGSDPH